MPSLTETRTDGEVEIRNNLLEAVHKLRLQEEGGSWSKKLTFCKLSYTANPFPVMNTGISL